MVDIILISTRSASVGLLLLLLVLASTDRVSAMPFAVVDALITDATTQVVARVYFEDSDQLNQLAAELDIWEVDHGDGSVVARLTPEEQRGLIDAGLQVSVLPERTAEMNSALMRAALLRSADATWDTEEAEGGIPYYPCYRTVEETYTDLSALAAANPNLATWSDIGDSWDKGTPGGATGYDLNALVLTNKSIIGPKPRLAVIAAIHAREYTTAELATRFAEHLVAQYGVDPDITWLLDYTEFHLIPVANPDGRKWAEQGYSWRKNTHDSMTCGFPGETGLNIYEGVDLNRNSSFKWNGCTVSGCSSADACSITYRGATSASEPETQVIEGYVRSLFPDSRGPDDTDAAPSNTDGIFISLHSYGELILYPWGWTSTPSPNRDALQTLGRKFGYYTGYEVCQVGDASCLYLADGTTDDWSYGELGIASYTFELGTRFFETCTDFEANVLDSGIDALTYAMKASVRPYERPSGPEIRSLTAGVAVGAALEELMAAEGSAAQLLAKSAESVPGSVPDRLTIDAGTLLLLVGVADDARFASNGHGEESAQAIAAAHYTVDAPSWITGTVSHPMSVIEVERPEAEEGADSTWAVVAGMVDTTGWAPGRHLLMVEAEDTKGQVGVPSATAVYVADPNAPRHRYYFPVMR